MVHAQTIHIELWNMDIVTIIVETYWKHKGLLYIYMYINNHKYCNYV